MTSKAMHLFAFSLILLFITGIFVNSIGFAVGFEEASAIRIYPDGTIDPSTAPISRSGNMYVLTEAITYHFLDIERDNIIIDGSGYAISTQGDIQSSRGIQLDANNVTIKNTSVVSFGGLAIIIKGSYNIIENNFMIHNGGGITIFGDYNTVTGNNVSLSNMDSEISIYGSHNNITQNSMWGVYIDRQATHNVIAANTLYYITLMGTDNTFYLNNLYDSDNSGVINKDANVQGNVFDYNGWGNYWSNYNGTDANNDGIGDTPYEIVSNMKDVYPLMVLYDASSQTIPPHAEQTPEFPIEILTIAIILGSICIILLLLVRFQKSRRNREKANNSSIHAAV